MNYRRKDIKAIESTIEQLSAAFSAINERIFDIDRLTAYTDALESMPDTLNRLADTIDELRARIDEIEQRLD